MAGLDSVNQTETTEPQVAPQVKPAATKSKYAIPTATGTVGLDPSILESMQQIVAEKEAKKNSFQEGLRDVMAYDVGYRGDLSKGLRERAAEKESNVADIFQMKNQIAQYKAAQEAQRQFEARRNKELSLGGTQGGVEAPGATQATGGVGPFGMSPEIRTALANAKTEGDYNKIYNAWAQKMSEMRASPEWAKEVEFKRQMDDGTWKTDKAPLSVAYQYAMSNPNAAQANPNIVQSGNTAGGTQPVSTRNNNPGNLVDSTGKIRTFATREEGEKALDEDLTGKLSGTSPAYKQRFGDEPVTPSRLAETWAPSTAPGNSAASTKNYGDFIAKKLGISPDQPIPNTPEAKQLVKQAITEFEAGVGSGAKPSATVAPRGGSAPSFTEVQTREAVEKAGQEEFAKGAGKESAITAAAIDKAGMTAGDDYVRASEIVKIASDPTMKEMFGVLEKGGVAPFILRQMENAINAGQFGTFGVKGLADNLAKAGAGPEQIAKYDRMVRNLATAELKWAQVYLKGQGAVSDAERELIRKAVGSASGNPAKVLVMQGNIMQERAKFDNDMAKAYDAYRDKYGEYANFNKFMRTEGRTLIQRHNNDLARILGVDASEVAGLDPYKKGEAPTESKSTTPSKGPSADEKKRWGERYGKKG